MKSLKEASLDFLELEHIAVTGVSTKAQKVGNYIYDKLKKSDHQVYAINPKGGLIGEDPCYESLTSISKDIDGVVIASHPSTALDIVKECAHLKIVNVWMHKSVDGGSYNKDAEDYCKSHGINLIPVGCPMMYCAPVDFPHRCIKWFLNVTGKLPKVIES